MKKRNSAQIIALITLATLFSTSAFAGHHRGGHRDGRGPGMRRMLVDDLDLSREQQDKIKKIRDSAKKATQQKHDEVKKLHEQMRQAWRAEKPNRKQIVAIHKEMHKLQGFIAKSRIDTRFKVMDVLTAAQQKELQNLKKARQANRQDKKGRRSDRGRRHGRRGGDCNGNGPGQERGQNTGF